MVRRRSPSLLEKTFVRQRRAKVGLEVSRSHGVSKNDSARHVLVRDNERTLNCPRYRDVKSSLVRRKPLSDLLYGRHNENNDSGLPPLERVDRARNYAANAWDSGELRGRKYSRKVG